MVVMRLSLEIADGIGAREGRETQPDELGEGGVTTQLDGFGEGGATQSDGFGEGGLTTQLDGFGEGGATTQLDVFREGGATTQLDGFGEGGVTQPDGFGEGGATQLQQGGGDGSDTQLGEHGDDETAIQLSPCHCSLHYLFFRWCVEGQKASSTSITNHWPSIDISTEALIQVATQAFSC